MLGLISVLECLASNPRATWDIKLLHFDGAIAIGTDSPLCNLYVIYLHLLLQPQGKDSGNNSRFSWNLITCRTMYLHVVERRRGRFVDDCVSLLFRWESRS